MPRGREGRHRLWGESASLGSEGNRYARRTYPRLLLSCMELFLLRAHAWKRRQSQAKELGMIADDTPPPRPQRVFISQTRVHSFGRGFQKYSERSQTPALRPAPAAALTQEKSPSLGPDLLYTGRARGCLWPRESRAPSMERGTVF